MYELEYISRWVLPPKYLNTVRNISKALLKPGGITRMDPENPRLR
jgi:hypothetical protein